MYTLRLHYFRRKYGPPLHEPVARARPTRTPKISPCDDSSARAATASPLRSSAADVVGPVGRSLTANQRLPGPGRVGQSYEGRTRLRGGPGPWATPWPLRAEPGVDSRSPDCGPTSVHWPRGGCAPPVHSSVAALFETGRLPVVARFKFPALHVPSLTSDAAAGRPGLPTRLPPVRPTACVDDCVTGPSSRRTRPAPTGPTVPVRLTPRVGRSSRVRKWERVLAARGYPVSGPGVTLCPWCPFRRPS